MLITLAWKNIWRNKKRSLIIIAAITFGLWGGLLSGAVMMGMGESMVNTAIDRYLAHIQIHKKDYAREKEITQFIPDGPALFRSVQQTSGVSEASARVLIEGMAASPASTFGVKIIGIDPQAERQVSRIHEQMIEGSYFEAGKKNPVIIGQKLAKRLNLKIRSKIILSFQGLRGELIYTACRVVGIFKTESAQFDEFNVFVNQNDLYRELESGVIFHEIALRTSSAELVPLLAGRLKVQYQSFDVQSWKEIAPEIAFLSETMKSFTYLFVAIILFALLFGITNTMLMSVMDRVRELGVLIAVGMKKIRVFLMILFETIFLSLTGGLAGIILGGLTIEYLAFSGIDLSAFSSSLGSFGTSTMLHPFLPVVMYFSLTLMILFSAGIAAVYPAWKATHLQPASAIRTY